MLLSETPPYRASMNEDQDTITVYSDYVCPFCYLGRRSLSAYQETREQPLEIAWHPFDLRAQKRGPDGEIDHSVDDGKDEAYFEKAKENVARLKEKYDTEEMLGMDEIPDRVDSLDAQAASMYVESEHPDRWLAFDEAIFEALWEAGRDIGDPDVLSELAEAVGLDGEEIRTAIEDETTHERLREAFAAAQETGVTGVPTFVYDEHAARGAVPPEHLQRLVESS
jgi:predicted DsbA family dithiol-disulfide isomerase